MTQKRKQYKNTWKNETKSIRQEIPLGHINSTPKIA